MKRRKTHIFFATKNKPSKMANTSTNLPSTALNQGRRGIIGVGNIAGEENRME